MKKLLFIFITIILGFIAGFNLNSKSKAKKYTEIMDWQGKVDGLDILRIHGNSCFVEHIKNKKITSMKFKIRKNLINSNKNLTIKKISGRGNIYIYQYPSPFNNNTLSIILDDVNFSGSDFYHFKLFKKNENLKEEKNVLLKWCGTVDKDEELKIDFLNKTISYNHISGSKKISDDKYYFSPNKQLNGNFLVKKLSGRGEIFREKVFKNSVILRIYDPYPGFDFYEFEILRGE